MNYSSRATSPRVFALLSLALCALQAAPARADWQEVEVCNEGSIEVAVAWAQETRFLVAISDWDSEGWQWVSPDACAKVWFRTIDTMAIVHLVTALRAPNGTFGARAERLNARDIPNGKSSLCVASDRFDIDDEVLPPCRAPYVEVPTAASFVVAGPRYEMKVTVRPGPSDYAALVPINGAAPAVASAAPPPATPYFKNDNTGDLWGSFVAAANEEMARRQQAQNTPLPAPPPPAAPPPALTGQAWIDATRAVISGVNQSCLAAGHQTGYCGCLSEELGFGPDNPQVNGLMTNWDDDKAHRLLGQDHTWRGRCAWMGAPVPPPPPPADDPRVQNDTECLADPNDIFKCVHQ